MPRFSRCFAVLVLILLVLPAALQAAPLPNASARFAWDVLAQVWSFFTAHSDNGCLIEPDGRCLSSLSAPATTDNGCRADPDGRCLSSLSASATTDNGCRADPRGLCLPGQSAAAAADNGCWIDPNGRCRN